MPDLIPKKNSPTLSPQPDIYSYDKINEKQNLQESTEKTSDTKTYAINNTKGFQVNTSVKIKDSTMPDIDKKDFNELNGTETSKKTESETSYTINKTAGYVVYEKKNDFLAKSASPTRTSALSNSIKDSESRSLQAKSVGNSDIARVGALKRVIDSPISLKTSTKPSTLETDSDLTEEVTPQAKPSTPTSQKVPPGSSPTQPNVFMNLFSKLSNKMSGPLLSSSLNSTGASTPRRTSSLVYEIPSHEFKECDHRLKLYFEVSLFTGGAGESLSCFIKVS